MSRSTTKTRLEIERLRIAAESLERVFADLSTVIRAGISTQDIENVAALSLTRHGLEPALEGYRGYPSLVCTSVNNVAAHGLPDDHDLREGDVVTVDISADRSGWKADAAWSYGVGRLRPDSRRLLRAAWRATMAGARVAVAGATMGDVGAAIEGEAQKLGCSVIPEFTGHGIGRELHEDPVVLHSGDAGAGMKLEIGMVINIEPILALGRGAAHKLDDGWSFVTADGSLSAQYEVTVAILDDGPAVLTLGRFGDWQSLGEPPY